jgi:hypothetical protein
LAQIAGPPPLASTNMVALNKIRETGFEIMTIYDMP